MSLDLIADSESHRAVVRHLIALYDRGEGKPVHDVKIAAATPYMRPVQGRLTPAVVVPNADGTVPAWFSHLLAELQAGGLAAAEPDGRRWSPTEAARTRLASFDADTS